MDDLLHIYGQEQWHDEAVIVGTRHSLTALRDAITKLLDNPRITNDSEVTIESSVADGEGFQLRIRHLVAGDFKWGSLLLPYTNDVARHEESRNWWTQP